MSTPPADRLVFVYGTLKRGFCRHFALAGERFLGEARTEPCYRMFNLGTYPGLVEVNLDGLSIQGEVWEVSPECLSRLDEIEGTVEGEYSRQPVKLLQDFCGPVEAYFSQAEPNGYPDCGTAWV